MILDESSTLTMKLGPVAEPSGERRPHLHRTLWYMGAKARVIPGFLERVLEDEVAPGATVVDLMSGTGVVAAFCADRYRVFANDVEQFAHVIARSLIEHDPLSKERFLSSINVKRDLGSAFEENRALLEALYSPALEAEDKLLGSFQKGDDGPRWSKGYRSFLMEPGAVYGRSGESGRRSLYAKARTLLSEESLSRYRKDPHLRPACLITSYHANVYFGLRQAIVIDSLRAAIESLDGRTAFAKQKKIHYLSALLHSASISTSGTSHFAQPRHLTKDSELRAMARRRLIDVFSRFEEASSDLQLTLRKTRHLRGNKCFTSDYRDLIVEEAGAGASCRDAPRRRFRFPGEVDLIYLDPPYTSDNYSRFYHVLEVLTRYDYPLLERDGRGQVVRGRYPRIDRRFQSGFCRPGCVEGEFRRVIEAGRGSGAKLVISYASPTGLLLKQYARRSPRKDPVHSMKALCLEGYRKVALHRLPMMHSGQGDSNLQIEELLFVCREPRL